MEKNMEYNMETGREAEDRLALQVWERVEKCFDKWNREVMRRTLFNAHRPDGARLDYLRLLSLCNDDIVAEIRKLSNHCRHDTWEFECNTPDPLCGWKDGNGDPLPPPPANDRADDSVDDGTIDLLDEEDVLDARKRRIDAMLDEEDEMNSLYGGR